MQMETDGKAKTASFGAVSFHVSATHFSANPSILPAAGRAATLVMKNDAMNQSEICRDASEIWRDGIRDLPRCPSREISPNLAKSRQISPNLGKSRQFSLTGGFLPLTPIHLSRNT